MGLVGLVGWLVLITTVLRGGDRSSFLYFQVVVSSYLSTVCTDSTYFELAANFAAHYFCSSCSFHWKSCEPNFTEEPLGSFDTRYVNRRTNQPFCFKTFDTKAKHKRASARVAIASEPKTTTGRQQYNNDRGNPISSSTSRSFLLYDHLPSASTTSPKFRTEL